MAATLEAVRVGRQNLFLPEGPFRNEPFTDFSRPENARAMRAALAKVHSELGREYPLIIGGENIKTEGKIKSLNPARPSQVVGIHQKAGAEHAEQAMQAALKAFETWRCHLGRGARLLLHAHGAIIRASESSSSMRWLAYEVGKNWAEADADVGETIDFLRVLLRARRCALIRRARRCSCPANAIVLRTFRWAWAR